MKINIKLNKLKFLARIPWLIAENVFLGFLAALFLVFIIAALVFCQYSVKPGNFKAETFKKSFLIKEEAYQKILKIWQENEQKFQEAGFKEYLDPFKSAHLPKI